MLQNKFEHVGHYLELPSEICFPHINIIFFITLVLPNHRNCIGETELCKQKTSRTCTPDLVYCTPKCISQVSRINLGRGIYTEFPYKLKNFPPFCIDFPSCAQDVSWSLGFGFPYYCFILCLFQNAAYFFILTVWCVRERTRVQRGKSVKKSKDWIKEKKERRAATGKVRETFVQLIKLPTCSENKCSLK